MTTVWPAQLTNLRVVHGHEFGLLCATTNRGVDHPRQYPPRQPRPRVTEMAATSPSPRSELTTITDMVRARGERCQVPQTQNRRVPDQRIPGSTKEPFFGRLYDVRRPNSGSLYLSPAPARCRSALSLPRSLDASFNADAANPEVQVLTTGCLLVTYGGRQRIGRLPIVGVWFVYPWAVSWQQCPINMN